MLGALRRCSSVLPRSISSLSTSARSSVVRPFSAAIISRSLHQTSRLRQEAAVAPQPITEDGASAPSKDGLITTFAELGNRKLVSDSVVQTLTRDMGLVNMTEVQSATINQALNGNDILAQAKTGTGKTLGFLIPVLQNILKTDPSLGERQQQSRGGGSFFQRGNNSRNNSGPRATADDIRAIIISPTRELAEQIANEARRLTKNTSVVIQTAVGGTRKQEGLRMIQRQGCHILVGTPGRLKDIFSDKYTGVQAPGLDCLVMDEADRLLDQGFWSEIREIMDLLPKPEEKDRQTLMFSATVPREVKQLVRETLKPGFDVVSTVNGDEEPTHARVSQRLVAVNGLENSIPAVVELCKREVVKSQAPDARPFKAIVYFNSTAEVTLAATAINELPVDDTMTDAAPTGYRSRSGPLGSTRVFEIHSRLSQAQRTRASDDFRRCKSGVLVSSDVTARGMDFPDVTHVIQVGMPRDRDTYIHRIGRTARAGKEGEGWMISPTFELQELRRKLHGLPLKTDDSLSTASIDMTREGDIPKSAATILGQVAEAYKKVPGELKADAYRGQIGIYGWVRKRTLVTAINNLSRFGWGMPSPPSLSPMLVRKLGLSNVPGVNSGGRMVEDGGDFDDTAIRSQSGGFGERRGGGGFGDRQGGGDRGGYGGDRPQRSGGFGDRQRSGGFGDREGRSGGFGDRGGRSGGFGDRGGRSGGYGDREGRGDGERRGGYGGGGRGGFGGGDRGGDRNGGARRNGERSGGFNFGGGDKAGGLF